MKKYDYEIDGETKELIGAPCCCYACDTQRQPGHYLCDAQDPVLVEVEQTSGEVYRSYQDGWRWFSR